MYNEITQALLASLRSIPGVPTVVSLNQKYTPVLGTPWIRLSLIPSEPTQITRGDQRMLQYTSLIYIDMFEVLGEDNGFSGDDIIKHFNALENRSIVDDLGGMILRAWSNTPVAETNWYKTPITLRVQWFST